MKIIAVRSDFDLNLLKQVAEKHTFIDEDFDCGIEHYLKHLDKIYHNPLAIMLLALDEDKPVGYMIAYKDSSGLRNEGRSFDVFILPEYQNQGLLLEFIRHITLWVLKMEISKMIFSSRVLKKETFEKYVPVKVHDSEYKEYYVLRDEYLDYLNGGQ